MKGPVIVVCDSLSYTIPSLNHCMWDEANLMFQIYGVKADDSVELFNGKEIYEAFIVKRIHCN